MSGWLRRLFPARPQASPPQARQLLDGGAILLDVREDPEWRAGLPVVASGGRPGRVL
jgi:hypothetical protein